MDDRIELSIPADPAAKKELHRNLVDAGQALAEDAMETFIFDMRDDDGRQIAACCGEIAFTSMHVSELWVDASLRGQGIGATLLKRAESLAAQQGCNRIHIETRNAGACRLYERLGFSIFGRIAEYADGEDLRFLEKPVTA